MTERLVELLKEAGRALEEGTDPFASYWLSEHNVTLHEVYQLSAALSMGAFMMAHLLANPAAGSTALNAAMMTHLTAKLEKI
jgi:hypothetical protein